MVSLFSLETDSLSVAVSLDKTSVVQLPDMVLKNKARQLKEVQVTGSKPMLERKIDRMVFNLSSSIAAKGLDLSQALALTPLLRVTDNSIAIIGKSGVAVMINDRIVNISGTDLINYLKSLRSDDVDRIEVITTPPAKYEAQGNSGLINIVLKKNPRLGWSGSVSTSYQQTTYGGYANNINLNYQSKKLSVSLKLMQYDRTTQPTEIIDEFGPNSILSNDIRKDRVYGYGANLSAGYQLSDYADIGFIYDISEQHYNMAIHNQTVYQAGQVIDSILNTVSQQSNPTFTHTLNLYYDQKLDKKGKKISTGFNYFSTLPKNNVNFETTSKQTDSTQDVRNYTNLDYKIWSAQSDLTLPYPWATIETGVKYTGFENNSNIGYYNLTGETYQLDPANSNRFDYHEQDMAAYFSAEKDFNKMWSAKAGLRYEYAIVKGYSPTAGSTDNDRYGKLFPSVYLSYKPDADNTLTLSYSKRINRPSFRALDPFRWYSNPYTYSTGNPFLQPSFNDNYELDYLFKGIFTFSLYEQKLSNGFGRVVEIDNDVKIVDYFNYLTEYNTGAEATIDLKITPWWENREFVSFNVANGHSALAAVILQNGSAFYYSSYNTFSLSKTISFVLNYWHSLPSTQGNVYSESRYDLSSGLKISMPASRLQLNLLGDDLLKGTVSKGVVYYQGFNQTYDNYYDQRKLVISLTYTFGKSKVTGSTKQVNFRETQRAN